MGAKVRAWKQKQSAAAISCAWAVSLTSESEAILNIQQYIQSFLAEKAPDRKHMMLASLIQALLDAPDCVSDLLPVVSSHSQASCGNAASSVFGLVSTCQHMGWMCMQR